MTAPLPSEPCPYSHILTDVVDGVSEIEDSIVLVDMRAQVYREANILGTRCRTCLRPFGRGECSVYFCSTWFDILDGQYVADATKARALSNAAEIAFESTVPDTLYRTRRRRARKRLRRLRDYVTLRSITFAWLGMTCRSLCAEGGAWRASDADSFQADV
jgi:hypothetical protein